MPPGLQDTPMRMSPDGRDLAIRNRDDKWFPWRVTDGSQRADKQVEDWLPLPDPRRNVAPGSETARPHDSDDPVTADERSALTMVGLWTDDPYAEFDVTSIVRAYRLGYEDGSPQ